MRKIDSVWKDLYEGYLNVRKDQQKLEQKWKRALKVAGKRKYQREHQDWLGKLAFERNRYHTAKIVCTILFLITAIGAVFLSMFSFAFGLAFPTWGTTIFIWILLIGILLVQKLVINNIEKKPPIKFEDSQKLLDIVDVWWNRLRPPPIQINEYGDEGEKELLDILERKLPNSWVALRQYKARQKLDADILILGPNGIWLFESKFNRGKIICRNGDWTHEKIYFEEGGKKVKERKTKRPYDKQWLAEKRSIVETIMRRVPKDMRWVANEIKGGIAFTHSDIFLDIDQSCQVEYGVIPYWVKMITTSQKIPNLTMDILLHVTEAVSEYSSQLSANINRKSAKQLAIVIYNKADEQEIPAFIRANV